jgi:hypothetical protein
MTFYRLPNIAAFGSCYRNCYCNNRDVALGSSLIGREVTNPCRSAIDGNDDSERPIQGFNALAHFHDAPR